MTPKDQGFVFIRNMTEGPLRFMDDGLSAPYCTGFACSCDSYQGWLLVGAQDRVMIVPAGMGVRVPAAMGLRMKSLAGFEAVTPEWFYAARTPEVLAQDLAEALNQYGILEERALLLEADSQAAKERLAELEAELEAATAPAPADVPTETPPKRKKA